MVLHIHLPGNAMENPIEGNRRLIETMTFRLSFII